MSDVDLKVLKELVQWKIDFYNESIDRFESEISNAKYDFEREISGELKLKYEGMLAAAKDILKDIDLMRS